MSIDALVSDTLQGKPQARTSKNGNPFATTTVRAPMRSSSGQDGESAATYVSVIASSAPAPLTPFWLSMPAMRPA